MRHTFAAFLSCFAFLGVYAGCSMMLAEERENETVFLHFSDRMVSPGTASQPEITATGDIGRITAQGTIGTGSPCHEIAGQAAQTGKEITLSVTATQKEGYCIAVVAAFGYEAALTNLEKGIYRLRILYVYPDSPHINKIVLEKDVRVR